MEPKAQMTPRRSITAATFWLPIVFLLVLPTVLAQKPIRAELKQAIEAAVPTAAQVTPKTPRKLLVLLKSTGCAHESTVHGILALQQLVARTGAFTVDLTDELLDFSPANLKRYDAVETHHEALCTTCYGADGMGTQAGTIRLGAPLVGSPRFTGEKNRLIALALKGMQGEVDGVNYGLMMPHKTYPDTHIADVLSHIRNSWKNGADLVRRAKSRPFAPRLAKGLECAAWPRSRSNFPTSWATGRPGN